MMARARKRNSFVCPKLPQLTNHHTHTSARPRIEKKAHVGGVTGKTLILLVDFFGFFDVDFLNANQTQPPLRGPTRKTAAAAVGCCCEHMFLEQNDECNG